MRSPLRQRNFLRVEARLDRLRVCHNGVLRRENLYQKNISSAQKMPKTKNTKVQWRTARRRARHLTLSAVHDTVPYACPLPTPDSVR